MHTRTSQPARIISLQRRYIPYQLHEGHRRHNGMGTDSSTPYPVMEFHISRQARDIYDFDQTLYQSSGNVIFPDFHAVRLFVQKMNSQRDLVRYPEQAVKAAEINAMGLIDEILHYIVFLYRQQVDTAVFDKALETLEKSIGKAKVDACLLTFVRTFPPISVYRGDLTPEEYLEGESAGVSNRELALEELLMLSIANNNPGFKQFNELFDDEELYRTTAYEEIMQKLDDFFSDQPPFGPENQRLTEMLKTPGRRHPTSLTDQLTYLRERWGGLLGKYLYRLLSSLDFIREEEKMRFGGGPGPVEAYHFKAYEEDVESFTPDKDWMPHVVLIAKTAYVWLFQLSREYNRPINRLDEIPDEELDRLAHYGFNALWLIGIWERSKASRRIKQICGNPEAEASAYSILAYEISERLGGWDALYNLKQRCARRGMRVASDMVPNHTAIDSGWVVDHPDWFIQLSHPPYPAYSYTGIDLCDDPRVSIFIEDHYYDRTDAAVTFKRVDNHTGEERYIYHGNDGTSMPWNDTAQINFLNPEAREAVIQTILHVARNFPIIRFDAAMTLAKKHYQRLWFPEPGGGGDIPSRSEKGMTKEEFNKAVPKEFWREVVDRIAEEAPDTLLLAEAFWMMEGYFVRSLGMHRVYNSAFMNMLKMEDNQKYRQTIKNTIEFDPEILNRYVNFMNNPDEETAVAQFGKGDKYFGICTLMVTMPGLPMFGHGQIEGYAEKYGMEYSRAYWDERPDTELVQRHERDIFPLMKKRYLFAGSRHFRLYDLYHNDEVNENVFAFSNRHGEECTLVIYNNNYERAFGWIKSSSPYAVKYSNGEKELRVQTLGEGLGLTNQPHYYTIFRDHRTGLHYIRNNRELHGQGMYVSLNGFEYQVFLDFREVEDTPENIYGRVAQRMAGGGFYNLETTMKEVILEPVHHALRQALPNWVQDQFDRLYHQPHKEHFDGLDSEVKETYRYFLQIATQFLEGARITSQREEAAIEEVDTNLRAVARLRSLFNNSTPPSTIAEFAGMYLEHGFEIMPESLPILVGCSFTSPLHHLRDGTPAVRTQTGTEEQSKTSETPPAPLPEKNIETRSIIEELWLRKPFSQQFREIGVPEGAIERSGVALSLLSSSLYCITASDNPDQWAYDTLIHLLRDQEINSFLGINRYKDSLYFNREHFYELVWWLFLSETLTILKDNPDEKDVRDMVASRFTCVKRWIEAMDRSNYKVEKLLELLEPETSTIEPGS